jgi:2'-5' RNA ligase
MSYKYSRREIDGDRVKEYAVVIFVPERVERFVVPLRERFDPDYDMVGAHITLAFPWESSRPASDFAGVIAEEVEQLGPLTIKLDSVGDFYPGTPIIYWRVVPNDALTRLHRRLHANLDLPLPFKNYIPHVSVGKEISPHRVVLVKDQIAAHLPSESFELSSVDLVSPVADQNWVSVRTFPVNPE